MADTSTLEEVTGSTPYLKVLRLASGGMGSVELAVRREGAFERLYALKRLLPKFRSDPEVVAMFLEEARVAGLIRHAHVVPVLDVGEDSEGPFLVMDYVEGVSLLKLVRTHMQTQQPVPVQLCVRLIKQVAEGLHAAHEVRDSSGEPLDLVHRDISPHNIMVGFDGMARLTDFGIAKVLSLQSEATAGLLKGKLGYMAPEQLRFEDISRKADLFSLGVTLYEALTSQRLYGGRREQNLIAKSILSDPPPDLGDARADVPPSLVELCFELLAKDPSRRPATAGEVASRLEDTLDQLIAEEGTFPVAQYMEKMFGAQRDETAIEIRELLGRLGVENGPPEAGPAPSGSATRIARPAPRKRRSRVIPGVLLGSLLVSGAVAGWATWQSDSPDAAESEQPVPPAASDEPAAATVPTEVAPEPTPGATVEVEVEVEAEMVAEVAAPASMVSRPSRTTMRRPRNEPSRMRTRGAWGDPNAR